MGYSQDTICVQGGWQDVYKRQEMREMLKEELSDAKKRVEELEQELKVLLLPKDPNDDKNVIVEFRAGAGGDEAALFTAEICRMYIKYAESRGWKTELTSADENGIGGFKDATLLINGAGAYSRMKYESGTHRVPVSYTHLDVYKRQVTKNPQQ